MASFLDILRGNLLALKGSSSSATSDSPITKFKQEIGRYPGNNKQWWVAKAQGDDPDKNIKEGDFLPKVLDKIYSGNNRAPRGHFLLNAFHVDRSAVSNISGFDVLDDGLRPNALCFFSGRAWYAKGHKVYYSQIITAKSKAGLCYQEADPTSEDISDLIASDGGVVPISEAEHIQKLVPISNGVMVFALNGVWFIGGGGNSFSAIDLGLDKVSSFGTNYPDSIISVGEQIFWWNEVGIHALEQASGQFGPIPGKFGNTNIAETTIQSFYNNIPEDSKKKVKGVYDPKNNVIQWLYSEDYNHNRYTHVLLYDLTLQAFYPWKIGEEPGFPFVAGVFINKGSVTQEVQEEISAELGTVLDNSLDTVTTLVYNTNVENRPTNLTYVTVVGDEIAFSTFDNRNYVDWASFNGRGLPYSSYVETGFELLDDAMRKKQAVRVFCHFRRTDEDALGVSTSCKFRTKWDWSANAFSNKWSREIEAYRPRTMRVPTTTDFEEGFPVVVSNNKVRGSGKALQFRFECDEPNKNFDLLGWSVAYVGNTEP